ncbi:hypothetical protein ACFLIM_36315 [Nonomuraea sp. M3C6]|uniref:MmyB-like transcription regulator ligand binding domain-containing protein n=1 Tax=Nonomuraea marmarensis TaxID=3351344 RepID=A0ABW7AMU2_9ACTN
MPSGRLCRPRRRSRWSGGVPGGLYVGHLAPHSPDILRQRPNMARLMFLDAHTRDLYADWAAKARAVVATLRTASGLCRANTRVLALTWGASDRLAARRY